MQKIVLQLPVVLAAVPQPVEKQGFPAMWHASTTNTFTAQISGFLSLFIDFYLLVTHNDNVFAHLLHKFETPHI